jgi:hypothetical protein
MPIEVKELIVRAWVDSQASAEADAAEVERSAMEIPETLGQVLEELKRKLTDKKDR